MITEELTMAAGPVLRPRFNDPTLAQRVLRRHRPDLSIGDAARLMGYHRSMVGLILSGRRTPSFTQARVMAGVLGMTMDQFYWTVARLQDGTWTVLDRDRDRELVG